MRVTRPSTDYRPKWFNRAPSGINQGSTTEEGSLKRGTSRRREGTAIHFDMDGTGRFLAHDRVGRNTYTATATGRRGCGPAKGDTTPTSCQWTHPVPLPMWAHRYRPHLRMGLRPAPLTKHSQETQDSQGLRRRLRKLAEQTG